MASVAICIFFGGVLVLVISLGGWRTFLHGFPRDDVPSPHNPLRPYSLQIVGLTFVLPVILVLGAVGTLNSEAISALMGSVVAFIFGTGLQRRNDDSNGSPPPRPQPPG